MAVQADWIKVLLSAADQVSAREIAHTRQTGNVSRRFRAKGLGSYETHLLGARGELAVCRYLGVDHPGGSYAEAKHRGDDVAGWQVRARSSVRYGLGLHDDDRGKFLLAYAHEQPVIWLAGWIDATEGLVIATPRTDYGFTWYLVDPSRLHPLPEQNGYTRRGETPWLIDPQTPFWCEACGGMHPIIEHRDCRLS